MKHRILASISVIAVMAAAVPVMAETVKTQNEINAESSTTGDLSRDAKKAWKNMKNDASEAYEEIKATFVGDKDKGGGSVVMIDSRRTANGIIGKPVYNEKGESVAKVTDIIVDENGKALMVIVADGEFVGMGKKAAFDYGTITRINVDGDVIMPITEKMIDNVASFSYDKSDAASDVRVMPANAYSVSKLLEGSLVDQNDKSVADVDNISFKNGAASQIIAGFDKTLGLGGKKAVVNYDSVKLLRDGDDLDFQLTSSQAAQFESFKKTATN